MRPLTQASTTNEVRKIIAEFEAAAERARAEAEKSALVKVRHIQPPQRIILDA